MKLLTKEQQESNENAEICYICEEKLENKYVKDKKYCKVKIIVVIQENINVLRMVYVI